MARNLDTLSEMEDFHNTVLPKLRRMLEKGEDAAKMYESFQSLIAARVITKALTTTDGKEMLAAAKEILDRGVGKPTENVNVTSRYEALTDEELDALLKSQKQELAELEGDEPQLDS